MSNRLMRIVEALVYFNLGVCLSTLFPAPRWWAPTSGSLAIVLATALVAATRRAPGANFLKNLREAAQDTPQNQYRCATCGTPTPFHQCNDCWRLQDYESEWNRCAREGCPMFTRNELCVQCLRDGWTHYG